MSRRYGLQVEPIGRRWETTVTLAPVSTIMRTGSPFKTTSVKKWPEPICRGREVACAMAHGFGGSAAQAARSAQMARDAARIGQKKERSSFLKKRSKRLLFISASPASRREQKFFGSFFRKRTAFLLAVNGDEP
jgi:hypothetical protein